MSAPRLRGELWTKDGAQRRLAQWEGGRVVNGGPGRAVIGGHHPYKADDAPGLPGSSAVNWFIDEYAIAQQLEVRHGVIAGESASIHWQAGGFGRVLWRGDKTLVSPGLGELDLGPLSEGTHTVMLSSASGVTMVEIVAVVPVGLTVQTIDEEPFLPGMEVRSTNPIVGGTAYYPFSYNGQDFQAGAFELGLGDMEYGDNRIILQPDTGTGEEFDLFYPVIETGFDTDALGPNVQLDQYAPIVSAVDPEVNAGPAPLTADLGNARRFVAVAFELQTEEITNWQFAGFALIGSGFAVLDAFGVYLNGWGIYEGTFSPPMNGASLYPLQAMLDGGYEGEEYWEQGIIIYDQINGHVWFGALSPYSGGVYWANGASFEDIMLGLNSTWTTPWPISSLGAYIPGYHQAGLKFIEPSGWKTWLPTGVDLLVPGNN